MVVVLAMVAPIHRTRNKSTGVDLFVDATYLAPRYRAAPSPLPAARYRPARTEKTKRPPQALTPCAFDHPLDHNSVVRGNSVSVRVEHGGRRHIKKKTSTVRRPTHT